MTQKLNQEKEEEKIETLTKVRITQLVYSAKFILKKASKYIVLKKKELNFPKYSNKKTH